MEGRIFWCIVAIGCVVDAFLLYLLLQWADGMLDRWALAFLGFVGILAFASIMARRIH